MDDRRKKSKEKYGWLSGASEKEVKDRLQDQSYEGKVGKLKQGLGVKDDKEDKPKKRGWNFFN